MDGMKEREKAFENLFAHDEELRFKAEAKACKALGLWAAAKLGYTDVEAEAYAATIVSSNLKQPGLQDVIGKVTQDLSPVNVSEAQIGRELERLITEAIAEVRR